LMPGDKTGKGVRVPVDVCAQQYCILGSVLGCIVKSIIDRAIIVGV
jgi:hypothetical protein